MAGEILAVELASLSVRLVKYVQLVSPERRGSTYLGQMLKLVFCCAGKVDEPAVKYVDSVMGGHM